MKKFTFLCMALIVTFFLLFIDTSDAKADVSHCDTLSGDETWSSSDNVHVVTCDVTVPSGTTLTIEPGAIIKFQENARLIVGGILDAQGTIADPIIFTSYKDDYGGDTNGDGTSSEPAPNDWGWVEFTNSSVDAQNIIENGIIRYGGKDTWNYGTIYHYGAVRLLSASPTISSTLITLNGNYAMGINTGSFPTVVNNTFTDNGTNGIGVYGGTISTAGTWTSTNYPYVLDSDITVAQGASLTISPGVIVKGKTNTRLIVQGVLDAHGTVADEIIFTSIKDDDHGGDTNGDGLASSPAPNDWGWVQFDNSSVDAQNIIENGIIQYGGKDTWNYGTIYHYGAVRLVGASPTISNTLITLNGNCAMGIDTGSFPTVVNNTFTGNGTNGICVYGGTISTAGTWNSTNYPYVLDSDITVAQGASLTISPGGIIKGRNNTRLIVQGVLDARGTVVDEIVFTSIKDDDHGGDTNGDGLASSPAPNDWGWVQFDNSSVDAQNIIENGIIQYGGRDTWNYGTIYYYGAVRLVNASPTISSTLITLNGNYAMGINTGSFPTVVNNTFTDNGTNGIGIYEGTILTAGTWNSTNYPYVLDADITVAQGAFLTISPGVIVKGKPYTRLIVQGVLDARGTVTDEIVFTSIKDDDHGGDTNGDGFASTPAANDWGWVQFDNSSVDSQNIIEHGIIQYGGKDTWNYGTIYYYGAVRLVSASPTISNTLITLNGNYAMGINTGSFPTVVNNTFTDNGTNGIGVYGGTISTDGTWTSTNYPYVMDADITVAQGASLTISPGVIVKGKTYTRLIVQGILDARGTVADEIVFTSIKDDDHGGDTNGDGLASSPAPNDWGWIEFSDTSVDAQNFIEHSIIQYGGRDTWNYGTIYYYGAVRLLSASPTISSTAILNNHNYGIHLSNSEPTLVCNDIFNNSSYGIYNATTGTEVIAENHWWGSTSGPYHPTLNLSGTGNRVTDGVDFIPWVNYPCTIQADLILEKSDSPDPVVAGTQLTYVLTTTNTGPSSATDVTIVDTLPSDVSFVSATPTQGSCSHTSGVVTCNLGTVENGNTANVEILVQVNSSATGSLSNQAEVYGNVYDPNTEDNTATTETSVIQEIDVSVNKSGPSQIAAGSNINYNIVVENNGPSNATGVTLTDDLPTGVDFVTASTSQGTCAENNGTVTCNLGILEAGGQITVAIYGSVDPAFGSDTISNTASVTANENDTNETNNTGSVSSSVYVSVDLTISQLDIPDPVFAGENLSYQTTVTNNGPSNASGVSLTNILPAGVHFLSATPSQGTCSEASGIVSCDLGNLTAGNQITVVIHVNVDASTTSVITNNVSVTGNESDPIPANNSVVRHTTVLTRIFLPIIFRN